jgi:transposase-like protein
MGKLSSHGRYSRGIVSLVRGGIDERRISPLRFKCTSCGATHALLPDILIPYSPYSLRFKLSALSAYFERDTTVAAVCERFGIAVSTLYEWKKLLLEHKNIMLGVLASRKTDALAFLRGLFESSRLSSRICDFFRHHAVSFLQNQSMATTRSIPP